MAVRSKLLVAPQTIGPGFTATLAPSPNTTWVVRTTTLVNIHAAAVPFLIGVDGTHEAALIVAGLTVPANGRRTIEEWWALQYPRTFKVQNTGPTHLITIAMFGAELDGLAP